MTRAAGLLACGLLAALAVQAAAAQAAPADTLAAPAGAAPAFSAPRDVSVPRDGPARVAVRPDTAGAASRALRRSLLLPGWGQITNGQPVKAPVIAVALVGAAAVLVVQQRRTTLYRRSALFAGCREAPGRDVCADAGGAQDEWEATGSPSFTQAAATRDQARGRRDLAGLAVAVVYALQALDAYVAGQLLGFDVGEAAAVRAVPGGLGLRVRL